MDAVAVKQNPTHALKSLLSLDESEMYQVVFSVDLTDASFAPLKTYMP